MRICFYYYGPPLRNRPCALFCHISGQRLLLSAATRLQVWDHTRHGSDNIVTLEMSTSPDSRDLVHTIYYGSSESQGVNVKVCRQLPRPTWETPVAEISSGVGEHTSCRKRYRAVIHNYRYLFDPPKWPTLARTALTLRSYPVDHDSLPLEFCSHKKGEQRIIPNELTGKT